MSESVSMIQSVSEPKSSVGMPQMFTALDHIMSRLAVDGAKFETKPTKVGATKLRKELMEIAKMSKSLRGDVLLASKEIKKAGKKVEPINKERLEEFKEEVAEKVVNSEKTRKKRGKAPVKVSE